MGRGGVKGRGRRDAVISHMYLNNNFSVLHLELCVILSVLSITVMLSSCDFWDDILQM